MTPRALLQQVKSGKLEAGYLIVGNETFFLDRCRRAIQRAVAGDRPSEDSIVRIDLKESSLARLLDETRTPSLFASSRLIIGLNAESALPAGRAAKPEDGTRDLEQYFADPAPGAVVLFESARLDPRDRDDKAKIERLVKFYAAVPARVEIGRLSGDEALRAAKALAGQRGLDLPGDALAELVEMLAGDLSRIDNELEKLALYAGDATITRADLELLTPESRESGVFELSDCLARKDRQRALEILDALALAGSYWPMQLTLLANLFRQALAVKEINGRNAKQVTDDLGKRGVRIWPARAQQLMGVARQFSQAELENALIALFEADRDLRRERPTDRIIMENLVVRLTG